MSLAKNVAAAAGAAVAGLAAQDLFQKEHALRRNFPLLARARYGLEAIGPELRQYIADRGLTDRITWIGSGKLGLPENALVAFALGADMVNVAREAMLSIGCIQAQKCHTDKCPTGVATQDTWLAHGIDPTDKSQRLARYVTTLRRDLLKVSEAAGVLHPALLGPRDVEILEGTRSHRSLADIYGYQEGWGLPGSALTDEITALMTEAPQASETEVVQHEPAPSDEEPETAVE
ncbi:glutamate synthase-related protein [Luteococcus peritonei]|uniref:Glutamate synthase-related protein n=1 Tax=Luteococcus peritonei TaxID=88874 RepID=A0ABW4RY21_9ACTN